MTSSRGVFTAHYNWRWVVCEAFASPCLACAHVASAKELPSSRGQTRAGYALFRLDVLTEDVQGGSAEEKVVRIRMDSPAMEGLDPKDLLYRLMVATEMDHYAPRTQLVPWDAPETFCFLPFPTVPAMLKAPLGSGGFGLYFVYHPKDVLEVMANHRVRAQRDPAFLPSVLRLYPDATLSWSIQELIEPVLCRSPDTGDMRRSQVRGYVVFCNGFVFVYSGLEVRLPSWDTDLAAVLCDEAARFAAGDDDSGPQEMWTEEVERECCGRMHARPYNEARAKTHTQRFLLSEVCELASADAAILACLREVFGALSPELCAKHRPPAASESAVASMAVLGVDLLVSSSTAGMRVSIVEVNNNPAMPRGDKVMSTSYRAHLVDMVRGIADLGHTLASSPVLDSRPLGVGALFGTPLDAAFTRC